MYAAQREAYIGKTIADWCREGELDGTEEVASLYFGMQERHGRRRYHQEKEDEDKWADSEKLVDHEGVVSEAIHACSTKQCFEMILIEGGEQLLQVHGGIPVDPLTASSGALALLYGNIHPAFFEEAASVSFSIMTKCPLVMYMLRVHGEETAPTIQKAALVGTVAVSDA
ncbi:unnamed protein product [Amoebophrya sp. A25]|nr:unnamed protein product [Amoebophrya sp. A25]|eukprot:GSA25T00004549001.1